jgi:uncharacterized protein YfeS
MDNLSRFVDFDFLEEDLDESNDEIQEDGEEGFEVVYSEEETESLYKDYRDMTEEPESIENQYHLSEKRKRREETFVSDLEKTNENDYLFVDEKNTYQIKNDFLKVEYTEPVLFNDQLTYQSVFMENGETGKTVYELTLESSRRNGMDIKISYDENSRTFYLDSMDGRRDGSEIEGNKVYLEFWVKDGETNQYRIGESSMDQEVLKKGDRVEWRLATERESYCGGGGYEKSRREKEAEQMLLYPNNANPIRGYFPDLGRTLERNPFFYTDLGLKIT